MRQRQWTFMIGAMVFAGCLNDPAFATPKAQEVAELIAQQLSSREVAKTAQTPVVVQGQAFTVKLWTNKKDEPYVEGDRLIIYVESDRDAYLKLDYYTAEGKVVHLVPNVYSKEGSIQAKQTYSFGIEGSAAELKVSAPFGPETIKALASSAPFDATLTESVQLS